jgi:hypothetical protein
MMLNILVRWLWSVNPQSSAISEIPSSEESSSSFAVLTRRFSSHRWGDSPVDCLKARAK